MSSVLLIIVTFVGYLIAYHTYGRFLAKRIFQVNPDNICPSEALRDDKDFVPTQKEVLFGHHFTSISGLGPIVGPAVAIIWGWLPAVLWVFFGSILMGAVHDFGSLIISLRGQGRSIGDLASDIVGPRVRILFLLIIFFALIIVIAIFALIIAIMFGMYPASVLPVWLQIPIAVGLGYLVYRKGFKPAPLGLIAVALLYALIAVSAYWLPLSLPSFFGIDANVWWIILLLIYIYIACTLPVQVLLQPRDYINSYQLLIAMGLLCLSALIVNPPIVAPLINTAPEGAPPLLPFLFVVIACGAISGFHTLVSSGTTSKQCSSEADAQWISFGGMLTESALSILVIVAVAAGIGLGLEDENGTILFGVDAFSSHYSSWAAAKGLGSKLSAFVSGSANLVSSIGIPLEVATTIFGVFLVSFAATTLDSAARIQRYVVAELAAACNIKPLCNPHAATTVAVGSAALLAFSAEGGKGALTLWPLFGSVNQLLAGLALLVITVFLAKKKTPIRYTFIPMLFLIIMTAVAMTINLHDFYQAANWPLLTISSAVLLLELWMILECAQVLRKYRK